MDLLVVGGSGFLGRELVRQSLAAGHRVTATYRSRPADIAGVEWRSVDVCQRRDVAALAESTQPDLIINAAYRQSDWRTTADGAAYVALAAVAVRARLVHVSSDAVFSGAAIRYDETSVPDPTTPYGAAKAAAETAVKGIAPAAAIVRTSLIIGDGGSPHELLVHALIDGIRTGVLFSDDVRCPVHVADLGQALLELAASRHAGIHHVAGVEQCGERQRIGQLIARRDRLDGTSLPTGRRADTNLPGPIDVRLDCRRTQARLKIRLRGAREFLAPPTTVPHPPAGCAR